MLFTNSAKEVFITEVGPRDGLQNEKKTISVEQKLEYIDGLVASGIKSIEVTSFVSPKAVPQMADAKEVFQEVQKKYASRKDLTLSCLVPNEKGYKIAKDLGAKHMAFFNATSETFSKKNVNASLDQVNTRVAPLVQDAQKNGIEIRGYVSTVFGCPYEGEISLQQVKMAVEKFLLMGVKNISLGDTTGVANPLQVEKIIDELVKIMPIKNLIMHFHDTRGLGMANCLASLQKGISHFDSSSGGLGGCPYAKGATGNIATEDLIYLCESINIKTGIEVLELAKHSLKMLKVVGKDGPSKYLSSLINTGKIS